MSNKWYGICFKMSMKKILNILLIILLFSVSLSSQNLSWTIEGRMPLSVTGGKAIVKDSLIYIIGGYSDSLKRKVEFIQEFNPQSKTWRIASEMRIRRQGLGAEVIDDSLYIFGGVIGMTQFKKTLEVWNFQTQPFYLLSNENFERIFPATGYYNKKLYLFGGVPHQNFNNPGVFYLVEFDVETKTITYNSNGGFQHSISPAQQMSVLVDSTFYIIGGVTIGVSPDIYKFSLSNKNFKRINEKLLKGRAGGGAVKLEGKKVLVVGGFNESSFALSSSELIDFSTNPITISSGPQMNFSRREFMMVRYKNSVYVFGGSNYNNIPIPYYERLDIITGIKEPENEELDEYKLESNYPNPFNPITNIPIILPIKSSVKLELFNILGEQLAVLIDEEMEAGRHIYKFNSSDFNLHSGIYLYRLKTYNFVQTKKMILVK